MKKSHENINSPPSTLTSLIINYHLELSNQSHNPPDQSDLSLLSPRGLISSLRLANTNYIESSLFNQQSEYETVLRHCEAQIRTQYKVLNQMKLQKEAMGNKILSLLNKEAEPEEEKSIRHSSSRHTKDLLEQKENEILILRAENSNLKSIHSKLKNEVSQLQTQIEELKKQFIDYNINLNNSNNHSNSNINININDISNSKVIIKANERYSSPLPMNQRRKRQRNINNKSQNVFESNSHSNRNVFMTTTNRNNLSPSCKTTQGSQCHTKPSINTNCNVNNNDLHHTILEKGSIGINTSKWWNLRQGDYHQRVKSKSPITKVIIHSSRQYHKGIQTNRATTAKSSAVYSPKTFRNNPKAPKLIKESSR